MASFCYESTEANLGVPGDQNDFVGLVEPGEYALVLCEGGCDRRNVTHLVDHLGHFVKYNAREHAKYIPQTPERANGLSAFYWAALGAEIRRSQEVANKLAGQYYVNMVYELRGVQREEEQGALIESEAEAAQEHAAELYYGGFYRHGDHPEMEDPACYKCGHTDCGVLFDCSEVEQDQANYQADYFNALQYDMGIDINCESCLRHVGGPGHYSASPRCRSGRRPHCTCDTCY